MLYCWSTKFSVTNFYFLREKTCMPLFFNDCVVNSILYDCWTAEYNVIFFLLVILVSGSNRDL